MSTIAEIVELYKRHCVANKCRVNSAVVAQLQKRSILTSIDLSANYVGCKGLIPVLEVVRATPTVETLVLSHNGLDNDAVIFLVEVLRDHEGVATLDLSVNPITFLGGKALLELVEHNTRITSVDVGGTDLYESIVKRITATVDASRASRGMKETMKPVPVDITQQGVLSTRAILPTQEGRVALVSSSAAPHHHQAAANLLPIVAAPTPRPPAPAVASDVVSRLTPAQRMAARENYRKRLERSNEALTSGGVPGDAASVARGVRDELEMLVKQQQNIEDGRKEKVVVEVEKAVVPEVEVVAVVEVIQHKAAPPPPPPPPSPPKEAEAAPEEAAPPSPPPPPVPPRRKSNSVSVVAVEQQHSHWLSTLTQVVAVEQPPAPVEEPEDPKELFKVLFSAGSEAYASHDMEAAYTSWSRALEVANECKNREWIAVITNNLQRLSFDLLMQQGNESLKDKAMEQAVQSFQMARDIAVRARNALWEADTERGIRSARHTAFQIRHDRASTVLDELTREGAHDTSLFAPEWDRMLKVKEAMECWADASHSASQMKGSAGQMLIEVAATALDVLYNYQFQRMYVPEITYLPRQTSQRTHAFTISERKQLIELYLDILSCARRLKHRRWEAVVRGYLGCLYHGVYDNKSALDNYMDLIEIGRDMNDDTFQAVGHSYVASHQLQLSRFSEADRSLRQAIILIGRIRKEYTARQLANPTDGSVRVVQPFASSKEYITYLEWFCYFCLQQVLVGLTRFNDALEASERCKALIHADVLSEKILLNFAPNMTLQNMIRSADGMGCVIVQYSVVYRVDWDIARECAVFEEHVYIWVIPKEGGIKFVLVETAKQLKVPSVLPLIQELRTHLCVDPNTQTDDIQLELPQGLWRNGLRLLYRALIYPIIDFLHTHTGYSEEGAGRVVIVPDGVLWLVPFAALLDESEVFLVEHFVISLAPSVVFTSFCGINTTKARERKGERRVVLTVPEDLQASDLVPFPFQGDILMRESGRLAKIVDGEVLDAGAEAVTKLVLRQTLANASFVHVSLPVCPGASQGHALGAFSLTGKSEFADLLYASDIEVWDVPAQIVGISHCNVDVDDVVNGHNTLVNLVRAWVSAGAASVVTTLWSTPDVMADDYFSDLYETLQCTHETVQAVTVSIRNVLKVYRHAPKVWAGYVIIGVDA